MDNFILEFEESENLQLDFGEFAGQGGVKPQQEKTVNPSTQVQIVQPDSGYELAKVTVTSVAGGSITPTATITGSVIGTAVTTYPVVATPSATVQTGYIEQGATGSNVTRYIQVEQKTATPSLSPQTVTPSSGKLLKSVAIAGIPSGSVTPSASLTGDEIGTTVTDYPVTATPSATVSTGYISAPSAGSDVTKYIQVEEKTATPSTSSQTITPTSGKLLKKVTVNAMATGSVTPSASMTSSYITTTNTGYPITATPSATVTTGYISSASSGSTVTRYIKVESKSATPTTSSQTITPSSGKLLSSVTVDAVSLTGDATASDVAAGKTFYNTSLTKITGTGSGGGGSASRTVNCPTVSGYTPIGGTASNKFELRRWGNVVQCTIFLVGGFTSTNTWLTFLASGNSNMTGYKPVFEAMNSCGNYADATYSSAYGMMRVSISTTGQIKITCSSSTQLEHIITMTYLTNDDMPT